MARSTKKGPYVDEKLFRKVQRAIESNNDEPIKTWARVCTIVPEFIGRTFLVHNGKIFNRVFVTEDMVGHRLGEFSPTRIFRGHGSGRRSTGLSAGPRPSSGPKAGSSGGAASPAGSS
ncbi:MAG: 30S ribosomal protein S19 [Phycisphaerae bacterium]|nr:30S ribosomal protein S19 [Phycisphaerae bacterium]